MPLFGNKDQTNNSPISASSQVRKTANVANRDLLYGNTTANAFTVGQTVGVFAVDSNEIAAGGGKVAHTGWVLRTVGSGGRAGRIQTEVLVAGGITTDAENVIYPQTTIIISIQPADKSANTNTSTTFSVGATSIPVTTLSYQWQANTGAGFANLSNAGVYSNVTTATLSIANVAGLNNYSYRVLVSATGGNTVTSANGKLSVV